MGCTSSSNGFTSSEQAHSFLKFRLTRLGNARPSAVPQLVIARIGHINSDLESPYSQKKCALYRIDLQERGSNGSWENRFSETDSADFILMDPDFSTNLIRVNSSNTVLIPRISDDELHPFELLSSRETSASTRNFLMRAGADTKNLEKYRVREVVFEYNAQLAVFGIVEEDATVVNKISQVLDITTYAHSVIYLHRLHKNRFLKKFVARTNGLRPTRNFGISWRHRTPSRICSLLTTLPISRLVTEKKSR
jgi:hypothetical protein